MTDLYGSAGPWAGVVALLAFVFVPVAVGGIFAALRG